MSQKTTHFVAGATCVYTGILFRQAGRQIDRQTDLLNMYAKDKANEGGPSLVLKVQFPAPKKLLEAVQSAGNLHRSELSHKYACISCLPKYKAIVLNIPQKKSSTNETFSS